MERFPPPDFDAGYKMPETTTPPSRAAWLEYVDVTVLLACLSLAAYLVLVKRSRRQVLYLTIFSALYFGFYRKGCICSVGSTQDVALALFNSGYTVPLTVLAFFLLPLMFTLFFGRVFCSGVCPLGAMQDLVLIRPVKVPAWLQHGLSVIPFVYLGLAILLAATGSAFIICQYDPFISFYRRSGSALMLSVGAVFLLTGLFVGRPYCRFLCPYGAMLNALGRASKWRVELTPNDCIRCQLCDVACPYGAISEPNSDAKPQPGAGRWIAIALLPVLLFLGAWLGHRLAVPLSKIHPTVNLAERILAEDAGKLTDATDASKAFRQTGRPVEELVSDSLKIRDRFSWGGWWLGGFAGLVIAGKLISPWFPRHRSVFEPDPATCVSCGRCYVYCPKEMSRVKKVQRPNVIPLTPV